MKYFTSIFLLSILAFAARGQSPVTPIDSVTYKMLTLPIPYDTIKFDLGLRSISLTSSLLGDPCKDTTRAYEYHAFTFQNACPDNPFHCTVCGQPFKLADAFVLYVTSVKDQITTAEYAHYYCTLKPKKK